MNCNPRRFGRDDGVFMNVNELFRPLARECRRFLFPPNCNLHFAIWAFAVFRFQLFSSAIFDLIYFPLRAKTAKARGVKRSNPTNFSRLTSEA